jgi:hypothetical protein
MAGSLQLTACIFIAPISLQVQEHAGNMNVKEVIELQQSIGGETCL